MRWNLAVAVAAVVALQPATVSAASLWGSPNYGDPPGWCTNLSDMWTASVVTNDPLVGTNPEQDTFYGFHPNPGYDDWFGFFYGDFRGTPGDASGWVSLLHETYPNHYHWNFADSGWAVHGHAKEYIAYYNWTFGGQCGLGRRGWGSPPPYMADQYGYPVVDIYVDSTPPFPPLPRVTAVSPSSVSFTWDPVADRGDGAGADYFASGMDHYTSWLTVTGRPGILDLASTPAPRVLQLGNLNPGENVCAHVVAADRLQNSTGDQIACGSPAGPPPMPSWPAIPIQVLANPHPGGLVGLESWFWLSPPPSTLSLVEILQGTRYELSAVPVGAEWDFGDGTTATLTAGAGFGLPYPDRSPVAHLFEAHSMTGYTVRAAVRYAVSWTAFEGPATFGPYPLGVVSLAAKPLLYPVEQAQPELVLT
jgi:hypothetical protein